MRLIKKLATIIVAAMIAAVPLPLRAEELPNLNIVGSITVTMKDGEQLVSGEELTLVKVASAVTKNDTDPKALNRGFSFECTDQFTAEQELVKELTADNAVDTAASLYAYAVNNSVSGTTEMTDENGKVTFSNLSTGLYLIWNSKAPSEYQTISPFLVTIPVKNKDSSFTYDVDAVPKMEKLNEFEPIVISDPPVQKIISGDTPSSTDRFLFTLKRLDSSYPLPVNDNGHVVSIDGDTMTLYADGAEKVEIGTFTFTSEGDYIYEVQEVNNGIEDYTYDSTVYWYKYEVRRDASGKQLTVNRMLVREGGAEGKTDYDAPAEDSTVVFKFTNTYHKKTTNHKNSTPVTPDSNNGKRLLPRTGQLWWPVMVLAAAGIILIVIGLVMGRRKHGSDAQHE